MDIVVLPDPGNTARFSALALARLTAATYRQVDHWCRLGVVVPVVPANGSGTPRLFDVREARIVAALAALSDLGAPLQTVGRTFAATLRVCPLDDPVWSSLVFVGGDGVIRDEPSGSGWLVDLGELDLAAA